MSNQSCENACERAARIRAALENLAMGQAVAEIETTSGNGVRQRVKYSSANKAELQQMLTRAQGECDALTGVSKRRTTRRMVTGG